MPRGRDDAPMPQLALPRLTRAVKIIFIVLAVFFVAELLDDHDWLPSFFPHRLIVTWLPLVPAKVGHGQLWRLLTYPLVNPVLVDVTPLLFGALVIYFFGPDLEDQLGTGRFAIFLVTAVALAGVIATLFGFVSPSYFAQPVVGIGAPTLALTAAWGTRFPNRRLFFPPIAGKWLVVALLGLEVVYILAKSQRESAASIGAIVVGWALARWWDRIDDLLDRLRIRRARAKKQRVLRAIRGGLDDRGKPRPIDKRFLN